MYNFSYLKLKIYFLCYKYLVSVVFVCDLEGASVIIELKENKKKEQILSLFFFLTVEEKKGGKIPQSYFLFYRYFNFVLFL